ncbi:MAG: riboflavin synthase [Chitinispirillaceae bacterium]|nr:riboflavin synthase [Chitinispirillaceae bacterium]
MFTGLIETQGALVSVEHGSGSRLLGIRPDMTVFPVAIGASVAVDGVCLTVESARGPILKCTAIKETLDRTTLGSATAGSRVNLERPLLANGRLDGHMVLGHVDGVGVIVRDIPEGAGMRRIIRVPESCGRFMAEKGSVAIDGISLTIAGVDGLEIAVALIPATQTATSMGRKRAGDRVNIECDVIARYLDRLMHGESRKAAAGKKGRTILEQMERSGF